jgi:hypothetical protein
MVVLLTSTVVLTLNSNVSYYTESRELVSVYLWTNRKDNVMNFTAIHSGVDSVKIHGQIFFEFDNGTTKQLNADLVYNDTTSSISGTFDVYSFKFGENITIKADITELTNGKIHYTLSSRSQILAKVDEQI